MSDTQQQTRTATPAVGTYEIDPSHTHVGFAVKHFGLSRTRGEFGTVSGSLTISPVVADSSTYVEIQAASFDSGDENRDRHVRSADFLDVEQFPTISFGSTALVPDGDSWVLHGDLSIKGVSRPVELPVEFEGETVDPYGNLRIAFSSSARIDRTDFGVSWNQTLETGGLVVGKRVDITIEVEAVRPTGG